ncbi:hypothetical protein AB6C75_07225, partial [Vibrio sp. 10N.237.312.B06]
KYAKRGGSISKLNYATKPNNFAKNTQLGFFFLGGRNGGCQDLLTAIQLHKNTKLHTKAIVVQKSYRGAEKLHR